MLEIKDPSFEPSEESKRYWMYVRKRPYLVGQVDPKKCPGLFQIASPRTDLRLMVSAIILEIWGLFMIVSVGALPLINILVLVALAFALDLVLAAVHHIPTRYICEQENEKAAARFFDPELPSRREKLCEENVSSARRWRQHPVAIAIFVVAAIKSYAYFDLRGQFSIFTMSVLASYIIVAYIHVMHTGYALFLLAARRAFRKDFSRFLRKDPGVTAVAHRKRQVGKPVSLRKVSYPVQAEQDSVEVMRKSVEVQKPVRVQAAPTDMEDKQPPRTLGNPVVYSWGVLTDNQVFTLLAQAPAANNQADDSIKALAEACIFHQLVDIRGAPGAMGGGGGRGRPEDKTFGVWENWDR